MVEVTSVQAWIVERLRASEGGVLGSALAKGLRDSFPDFDIHANGFANLKSLVLGIPTVGLVGRSGSDVIFNLSNTSAVPNSSGQPSSLWSAWAFPSSRMSLAVYPNGDVQISPTDPNHAILSPLPEDSHKSIAHRFLLGLSDAEELKSDLIRILDDSGNWWPNWLAVIKQDRKINTKWIKFRLECLYLELKSQLSALGISEEAQAKAFSLILDSRQQVIDASHESKSIRSPRDGSIALHDLRKIVKLAIDSMSFSEIDSLAIPPSVMIKVMTQQKPILHR